MNIHIHKQKFYPLFYLCAFLVLFCPYSVCWNDIIVVVFSPIFVIIFIYLLFTTEFQSSYKCCYAYASHFICLPLLFSSSFFFYTFSMYSIYSIFKANKWLLKQAYMLYYCLLTPSKHLQWKVNVEEVKKMIEKNKDKYILQINKDRCKQKYFIFYIVKFLYTLCFHVFSSLVTHLAVFMLIVFILLFFACAAVFVCMIRLFSVFSTWKQCFMLLKISQNPCFTPPSSFFLFPFLFSFILNCLHYFQFKFHFP